MDAMLGLYIHVPFCASKCSYCDFYSVAGRDRVMDRYQAALIKHITEASVQMEPYYIDTIYFGGGTPSYYGARRICEILDVIKNNAKVLKTAEITVEMNPDSVSKSELRLMRAAGVNRVSLGVQSASDDILRLIGRRHNYHQVEQAVKMCRAAGFGNISIDLIYGLPTQTKNEWADTLSKVIALKPTHLSCYGLALEEGTPMYQKYKGSQDLPDDDEQADMYLFMTDLLARYGYAQYEISNFARPGYESRHNLKYWQLSDYMGFGPAAHSCVGNVRYSYVRSLKGYIDAVNEGSTMIDEYETIGTLERAAEYIMLGMRTARGISKQEYSRLYRSGFDKIEYLLEEYGKKGWVVSDGERWHFSSSGFLLSNILIGTLLEAQSQAKMTANPWMMDEIGSQEPELTAPSGGTIFN